MVDAEGTRKRKETAVSGEVQASSTIPDVDKDSGDDVESSSGSEESSASESDAGPVDLDEVFAEEVIQGEIVTEAGTLYPDLFQHKDLGTLHRRKLDCPVKLACGRVITDVYHKINAPLKWDWPKCKVCYGTYARVN